LGLPFPKELAPLGPRRALIDSSLDLIREVGENKRIILMDDGNRKITADYVQRRLSDVPLARVRQDRYAADWPDGVLKLQPWWGDVNVVLLPDSVYEASGLIVERLAALAQGSSGFALGVVRMPPEALKRYGAVTVVQDDTVRFYEDKPEHPERFNAAWGMLAFANNNFGVMAMQIIADSTRKQGVCKSPVVGSPVIWLNGWRDLGAWDTYSAELRKGVCDG
jgi:UTP-glucose-1-phosphate uridylyltransferase